MSWVRPGLRVATSVEHKVSMRSYLEQEIARSEKSWESALELEERLNKDLSRLYQDLKSLNKRISREMHKEATSKVSMDDYSGWNPSTK